MKYSPILLMVLISNLAFSQLDIVQPSDIIMQEFPFDGQTTFDLRVNEDEMLNGITPSTVSFSYFNNLNDATLFSNTIGNAHAYTNTANPQTIYVRVQDWFTNEFAITEFDLIVEDNLNIVQPDDILLIDSPFDGFGVFDLTQYESQMLDGIDSSLVNISYHLSSADANSNVNPIPNETSYTNTSKPETVYIRVENASDSNQYAITNFQIFIESSLNLGQPEDLIVYELSFDGFASFDLTTNEEQILNELNASSVALEYYLSQIDADTQSNPINNPTAFVNISNPQPIYARVSDNNSSIFSTTNFNIEVSDDFVNIPDASFLAQLIGNGIDTNGSGNIQSFEALAVTQMEVGGMYDITGIDAFVNLTSLSVGVNDNILDVDLSSNLVLEELILLTQAGFNGVNLNISNNQNLKILRSSVPIDDVGFDLSNNILLEELVLIGYNPFTELDLTHNINLTSLYICGSGLTSILIKNGIDESTNIDNELWMNTWSAQCAPFLEYVCADPFQVDEIQGFANGNFEVNSFCDVPPGGDYNTITGTTQFDLNNNGCDPSDTVIPYIIIEVGTGPSTITPAISSDEIGVYKYYVEQPEDITLQPFLEEPSYFNISPNFPLVNIPVIDNSTTIQDFCLTANGAIADAEVVIAPILPSQPGFDATYGLVYKNKGNQVLSGNVTLQYDDSVLDFVSSTTVPDAQSMGQLTFNFTNLVPFESRSIEIVLNVNGPMETPPINIDDVLNYTANISVNQTEETPADNAFDYSEIVVGAYDPNDITCLQGDVVPETQIGEFLHYMIRFENTGNAPAQTVVVTSDINPAEYNVSTLQVLNASHDMFTRINNNVVEFVFENIQLPGNGGQGNILLKIKTQPTLVTNDEVQAKADIYFDFNFPITTNIANTAFSELSTEQFSTYANMVMYPNSSDSFINIEASSQINNIRIFDLQGRTVLTLNHNENTFKSRIDIFNLRSGVYVIQLETLQGRIVQKLIKE